MRGTLIYVASPFTSPDKTVEAARNVAVALCTGYLMNKYQEYSFYSPICHTVPIALYCNLPGGWEFWRQFDETVLSRCDEMWVLCIPEWRESKGVNGELEIAAEFDLPIRYIIPVGIGEYLLSIDPPEV